MTVNEFLLSVALLVSIGAFWFVWLSARDWRTAAGNWRYAAEYWEASSYQWRALAYEGSVEEES